MTNQDPNQSIDTENSLDKGEDEKRKLKRPSGHKFTFLIILGVTILAAIPLKMLNGLVEERSAYKHQVTNEIAQQWGRPAVIGNFSLHIPYEHEVDINKMRTKKNGTVEEYTVIETQQKEFAVAAKEIHAETDAQVEKRYKGIYTVPIFTTDTKARVIFAKPVEGKLINDRYTKSLYKNAYLRLGFRQSNSISSISILVDGEKREPVSRKGEIILPIDLSKVKFPMKLDIELKLNGTDSIHFVPSAEKSVFSLRANWPDPKFWGDRLPRERTITDKEFNAIWEVTNFSESGSFYLPRKAFGVQMIEALNVYQETERSLKYGELFVFLTLLGFLLIQVINGFRIHPVQIVFLVASMIEFYFLLLSLSEHIPFAAAYLIAAFGTVVTIGLYSKSLLKSIKLVGVMVSELVLIYLFLYMTIASTEYALLIGSVGLFVVLGIAMYVTRKVDWSALQGPQQPALQS